MISSNSLITNPRPVLQSLARFDTSKAERLRIVGSYPGDDAGYNMLLPMRNLRALTISRCKNISAFIRALYPARSERANVFICPKLEELVLDARVDGVDFDFQSVIDVAAVRAASGAGLKYVRIVSRKEAVRARAVEPRGHVLRVVCGLEVGVRSDVSCSSGEED